MDYTHVYASPLGEVTVASDGECLVGLWFSDGRFVGEGLSAQVRELDDLPVFRQADGWLDVYFSGRDPGPTPPLEVRGTPFRRQVCELLLQIPYGQTRTYGELAAAIAAERGRKTSARAVGGAVGHNPLSIMIPCHRVVGAGGKLTGYGGGIQRKARLLQLEGAEVSGL